MIEVSRWFRRSLPVMLVGAALLLAPEIAVAQDSAPPQPQVSKTAPVWLGYAAMFLTLALLVGVSLMPSKRAHQD